MKEQGQSGDIFDPGRNCWRVASADRATLIVDAADYYEHALHAMLNAREQIILIGWDLDTRVKLIDGKGPGGAPTTLGALLSWVAGRGGVNIYVLVWDQGLISLPGRGTTLARMLRWAFDPAIDIKWDSKHPLDGSHHQKTLVIDDKIAFCGGIDITADRWDTRHHHDDEPGRRRPFTGRKYEPWHDAIMAVDGEAARALGDLARLRWRIADGRTLPVPRCSGDPWPKALKPRFRDVRVGIARTRGKDGDIAEVREIEALFVDLIARAKRYVYVETQYFASRVIAEAIASRLGEEDGPEFVIVNPRHAYGWLDEAVMSPARYELLQALAEKDRYGRFRIYSPVTECGADIYVHAKLMFVDDIYLRVGSANMNNRSMGLDSECDLLIDGTEDEEARRTIADIGCDMLAEHFGCTAEVAARALAEKGSLIAAIESLRGEGRSLRPLVPEAPNALERKLARAEIFDPEGADELFERRSRPGLLSRLGRPRHWRRRAEPSGGGIVGGAKLFHRHKQEKNMSRIPSKAMPHAYAPTEGSEGSESGGEQSLTQRAGSVAKKVGGSRVAQVAAGAVVAGAVAVAATKIVRGRRAGSKGEEGSGGESSGGKGKAKKSTKD